MLDYYAARAPECNYVLSYVEPSMRDAVAVHENVMLEVAILDVIPGKEAEFEAAFSKASVIIFAIAGYISHQLQHSIENNSR